MSDLERNPSRHVRRKAQTRARITAAANQLFAEHGYLQTSVEDISEHADVSARTIYLHFPSKAAILLDHFDRWLDALVEGILARPADEPIAVAVAVALRGMTDAGWVDRSYGNIAESPPSALGLITGPPEVAGAMMHAWAQAQDRIAQGAAAAFPPGSLVPRARATAVFAACMGPIVAAKISLTGVPLPEDATANGLIEQFLVQLTRGDL